MKKYCITLILLISALFINVSPCHAIKIGLDENIKQTYVGTSKAGQIIDGRSKKPLYYTKALVPYTKKAHNDTLVIKINGKYYNFGTVSADQSARFVYKLTNTGKSVLKIHRVYANDKRLRIGNYAKEVQPGATVELPVETVKGAEQGKLSGIISVITNCPSSPETSLRFYGEIK